MAELNTDKGGGGKKKKMSPGVDLTAMVDLAFLLITFFMLTTTLSKPQSMNLAMPDKSDVQTPETETKVSDKRTVTIVLGTDNKLLWYRGLQKTPIEGPKVTTYGKDGIRQVLLEKNQELLAQDPEHKKGLIAIIMPSDKSRYNNLVDILDEMVIAKVETYAIVDITPADIESLKTEKLYPAE